MKVFIDQNFSRKIERTEARASADFVASRAQLSPETGAEWIEIAGAYVLFDGAESPLTQTFGLGLFEKVSDYEFEEIELFFKKRGAPVIHEISPLADISIIGLLNERGYQPCELTTVMFRSLEPENSINIPTNAQISTRMIAADEINVWAETAAAGWASEMPELAGFMKQFCAVGANSKGVSPFIAEIFETPAATGSVSIYDDIALLSGASTIPAFRRQGAQNALLAARLNFARESGCVIAIMGALPGSQSQKNAEKNDFQTAYTRVKWQLKRV